MRVRPIFPLHFIAIFSVVHVDLINHKLSKNTNLVTDQHDIKSSCAKMRPNNYCVCVMRFEAVFCVLCTVRHQYGRQCWAQPGSAKK